MCWNFIKFAGAKSHRALMYNNEYENFTIITVHLSNIEFMQKVGMRWMNECEDRARLTIFFCDFNIYIFRMNHGKIQTRD